MNEVLSQKEIDELLKEISTVGDVEVVRHDPKTANRKIRVYDFRRPERFLKNNIRAIQIINEKFAHNLTRLFTRICKTNVRVHVLSIDQLTYEEWERSVPTPCEIATLTLAPLRGEAQMEIDLPLTEAITRRMAKKKNGRKYNAIKEAVIFSLADLREAWCAIIDLRPDLIGFETSLHDNPILLHDEPVVLISFECLIDDVEGMINLCIPSETLRPVMDRLTPGCVITGVPPEEEDTDMETGTLDETMDRVKVPLRVELGTAEVTVKELRNIHEGSIFGLDEIAGAPLAVYAGDVLVGRGEAVVIGEKFGIRFVEVAGKQ